MVAHINKQDTNVASLSKIVINFANSSRNPAVATLGSIYKSVAVVRRSKTDNNIDYTDTQIT